MKENKYRYYLNGKSYFIWLTEEDKAVFEDRYGVYLEPWD